MSYLIQPDLIPFKRTLTALECLSGGAYDFPTLPQLGRNEYYIIIGVPYLIYNFNTVDFDQLFISLQNTFSGAYYCRIQITSFPGFSIGTLFNFNTQAGPFQDILFEGDTLNAIITSPASAGDGTITLGGYVKRVTG